jgi:hypothetical protein
MPRGVASGGGSTTDPACGEAIEAASSGSSAGVTCATGADTADVAEATGRPLRAFAAGTTGGASLASASAKELRASANSALAFLASFLACRAMTFASLRLRLASRACSLVSAHRFSAASTRSWAICSALSICCDSVFTIVVFISGTTNNWHWPVADSRYHARVLSVCQLPPGRATPIIQRRVPELQYPKGNVRLSRGVRWRIRKA